MIPSPFLDLRIRAVAASDPRRPALVEPGAETVDYGTLENRISEGAERLRDLGIGPGVPVVQAAGNGVGMVTAYFAILRAGGTVVPFGSGILPERIALARAATAAPVVVADNTAATFIPDLFADLTRREVVADGMTAFAGTAAAPPDRERAPSDLAYVIHTSGTTGEPKGVMMSHRAATTWIDAISKTVGYDGLQREATILSLAHSYGLGQLHCVLFNGGFAWIQDGLKAPQSLFRGMTEFGLNSLAATPSLLRFLIERGGPGFSEAAASLRLVTTNSEAVPRTLAESLFRLAPDTRLVTFYGLTEAPRFMAAILERNLGDWDGDVGRPFPGGEVAVRDGEVFVRGPNLYDGYWGREDLTSEAMVDGWLRTGDLGRLDDSGLLTLIGRKGETVNVGGIKVSPQEVERLLAARPELIDTAVVGIPDPLGVTGQRVGMLAVARSDIGEADLRRLCAEVLEAPMRPAVIRLAETVPRASGGKIRRDEVRRILES